MRYKTKPDWKCWINGRFYDFKLSCFWWSCLPKIVWYYQMNPQRFYVFDWCCWKSKSKDNLCVVPVSLHPLCQALLHLVYLGLILSCTLMVIIYNYMCLGYTRNHFFFLLWYSLGAFAAVSYQYPCPTQVLGHFSCLCNIGNEHISEGREYNYLFKLGSYIPKLISKNFQLWFLLGSRTW